MPSSWSDDWRSLYPFRSQAVDVGGLQYHYVDEGTGPPIVFVHGNPTWSFYWRTALSGLDGHRRLAPDHIGMGLSDRPRAQAYDFRLETRIADFGRFIEATLQDEPFTLVVHDWGGAIGLGWAVEHAAQVNGIVVLNTAAFHLPAGKTVPWALRAARGGPFGAAAVVGANAFVRGALRFGARTRLDGAVRTGYLAPYDTVANRAAVLAFVRDIPLDPTHPTYSVITRIDQGLGALASVPMLICWGGRDFVFDDDFLAEWVRRFPDATVEYLSDAGHLVMEDAGDKTLRLIRAFAAI